MSSHAMLLQTTILFEGCTALSFGLECTSFCCPFACLVYSNNFVGKLRRVEEGVSFVYQVEYLPTYELGQQGLCPTSQVAVSGAISGVWG